MLDVPGCTRPRRHVNRPRRSRGRSRAHRWRALAYVPVAVGVARARRAVGVPQPLSMLVVGAAPLALARGLSPGKARAAAVWAAHMWAYKVAFELPYDRPEKLRARLHIDEPIRVDAVIGAGTPPTERLQRRLRRPPRLTPLDRALSALYYTWEVEPHAVLAWILLRHPGRFAAAAARLGATFDLTLVGYWTFPAAPPWWASEREGRMSRTVRRVVYEVAAELRGKPRPSTAHNSGANPWAAMPSDHFATAAMTAILASEINRRAGLLAWTYALSLGGALVYTGEHYVTDLLAGLALAVGVNAAAPGLARPAAALATLAARRSGRG
jgi:membrane-associated phospholipid phosphatase